MRFLLGIILLALIANPASARSRHHHARAVQQVAATQFWMPLASDVADYGSAPRASKVRRVSHPTGRPLAQRPVRVAEPPSPKRGSSVIAGAAAAPRTIRSRPSDCYGIAWCGCYMRHYFGIADKSFNLARRWASVGSPSSPRPGAIVVWSHHVGLLRSSPDGSGRALVLSGNDGHAVRLRRRSIRNAIAFRAL